MNYLNFAIQGIFHGFKRKFMGGDNGGYQNKKSEKDYSKKIEFKKRSDYAAFAFRDHQNPYLEAVIKEMLSNSVGGNGIAITPQPRKADGSIDVAMQKELQKLWTENKDSLDAGGRHSWAAFNKMVARELFAGGEVFLVKFTSKGIANAVNFGFMIKDFGSVPFDTVGDYRDGIKCNFLGKALSYQFIDGSDYRYVEAKDLIHAACYYKSGDTRGFSQVAGACELAVEIDYYDKETSQLVAASKRMTYWCVSDSKPDFPAGLPLIHVKGDPSKVNIQALSSNLTNTFSKEHRKNLFRSMCAAVGTGFGATSGEFDGSYSASRQEMIVAAQNDLDRQTMIIDTAIKPVYEAFVLRCIENRLISYSEGDIFAAKYTAPRREHIDPLKEAKAISLKLATNQILLSDVLASQGKDFDLFIIHLKDELTKLEAAGLQPNGIEALKWLQLNVANDQEEGAAA